MQKTLNVMANPWAAIDEQARPCGSVLMDLDEHNPHGGKYIGAKLKAVEVQPKKWRKVGRAIETTHEARYDRQWEFSDKPQQIPARNGAPSGYYQDRLRSRELIPADRECASACGVRFVSPAEAIEESKAARRLEFDAQHGTGAFDALQPVKEVSVAAPVAAEPSPENTQVTADPKRSAKTNKS